MTNIKFTRLFCFVFAAILALTFEVRALGQTEQNSPKGPTLRPQNKPLQRSSERLKAKKVDPPTSVSTGTASSAISSMPDSQAPPIDQPASGNPPVVKWNDTSTDTATIQFLRALEARNSSNKTIHATFHQTRYDDVFVEKVDSEGELWFEKPARLRCDYSNPQRMITLITDNALYIYTPELKQVDYWKFASDEERDAQLHYLLIGFGLKTDELLRHYSIQSSLSDAGCKLESDQVQAKVKELRKQLEQEKYHPQQVVLLEVRPRPEFAESTPFTLLKVWIDKTSMMPQKIWYSQSGANITLTMKKIDFNTTLAPALFDTKSVIPPGTEFIDKRESP